MQLVKMTASVSSFLTNGKYWTTECIRHPKRRLCVCCPNGAHVDVDFDAFYKTLTKMQKPTSTSNAEDANKPYKAFIRKQDPTIDALLGYRTQPSANVHHIVYKSRDAPAKASPDVRESLEQALHDFEETLIRSSTSDARSPITSPLLNDHFGSSSSIRSDTKSDCLQQLVNGDKQEDRESTKTTPEFRRTPVDFKTIITEFRRSPTDFTSSLTDFRSTSIDSKRRSTSSDSTTPSLEAKIPQKSFKNVGVNCVVITRDIGTTHVSKTYQNCSTNTEETIEGMPASSRFSLQQILQQPKYITVCTQTISKITPLEIVEKRDYGIQTEIEKPTLRECKLKSLFESTKHRSVATSTELSPHQEFSPHVDEYKRTYSKFCQTKDMIVRDRILLKKVGCQTDFPIPHRRDVATNTIRQKMVDESVGESTFRRILCDRCNESNNNSNSTPQSVSKIPRPKNIPVNANSNKKKLLMRQDTYVTTPSIELENLKLLQIQESLKISEPSDQPKSDATSSITYNPAELNVDKSYFQPILESKPKAEPSKEMKAAMKVFNDSMKKSLFSQQKEASLKSAINIIQQEWFKVSSLSSADPLTVEDYLDAFEEVSTNLLEYIVNMRDGAGNTAMHYAVSHGNFDVVSILLDSKVCDINIINDAGYTCVMLVSLAQIKSDTHRDVIRRLFSMADVNLKAKQHGQTTLMLAASHGKVDVVRLLLESGADVNIQDDDGSTALMCAAEHGYLDIVNTLAEHPDCDLTIKDNDGSTALTIAMEAGHREIGIALYTRQHFADLNHVSAKEKRSRSANPILMEHRTRTPSLKSAPSSPLPLT